jgi:hypothetical protein
MPLPDPYRLVALKDMQKALPAPSANLPARLPPTCMFACVFVREEASKGPGE